MVEKLIKRNRFALTNTRQPCPYKYLPISYQIDPSIGEDLVALTNWCETVANTKVSEGYCVHEISQGCDEIVHVTDPNRFQYIGMFPPVLKNFANEIGNIKLQEEFYRRYPIIIKIQKKKRERNKKRITTNNITKIPRLNFVLIVGRDRWLIHQTGTRSFQQAKVCR